MKNTHELIQKYYESFNHGQDESMLSCLEENVIHEVNQGKTQEGKEAFRCFLKHMNECYKENLTDLVIMSSQDGKKAAAEFIVNGKYLKTDGTLPPAHGQEYKIKAGTFFEVQDGLISRVTTYYNLPQWIEMVK